MRSPISAELEKSEKISRTLSTVLRLTASYRQNRKTEVVSIENLYAFFNCYRMLINSCRLAPDQDAAQLSEILRRVRDVRAAAAPPVRPCAVPIQAGGSKP